ncbi:MAG: DNA-processing protein DprA [Eubacteriales bacterium]
MSYNYSEYEKMFIRVALTKGMTLKLFNNIIEQYVDLKELFADARKKHLKITLPMEVESRFYKSNEEVGIDKFILKMDKMGINLVTRLNPEYPMYLREIYDAPNVLFVKGNIGNISDKIFSIVGTRKCTRRGYKLAEEIACDLASAGVTVVSGMARGIDSAANTGAINAGGVTVAVLGCGVDIVYPKENAKLYDAILENGAIISEYVPGTRPLPSNFPKRNRIISGMSVGVLVIESSEKGGSSITAKHALLQGRDVFVGQGGAFLKNAELANILSESGCRTITSAKQILEEYSWGYINEQSENKNIEGLDFLQQQIYNLLLIGDANIEELSQKLSVEIDELNTTLTIMELLGLIKRLPGLSYTIV